MAHVYNAVSSKFYIVIDKDTDLIGSIKGDALAADVSAVALAINTLQNGTIKTIQTVTTAQVINE